MSATPASIEKPVRPAGLTARLGAFFLDCLILGLVGWGIGAVAADQLIALGGWGRLVGFVIALVYFVPQDSELAGGQTLGKRLLKLRVVGRDGLPIGLGRAALRYLAIGLPWFLNGAILPALLVNSWAVVPISLVIFGLGVGVVYLALFNRRTGQGLHDLIAETWVLGKGRTVPEAKVARVHRYVLALILVLSALAPILLSGAMAKVPFTQLRVAQQAVESTGMVFGSYVNKGTFSVTGKPSVRILGLSAFMKHWPDNPESEAHELAGTLLAAYGSAADIDQVTVRLVYGYDIGIASWSRSQTFHWPPANLHPG